MPGRRTRSRTARAEQGWSTRPSLVLAERAVYPRHPPASAAGGSASDWNRASRTALRWR